jgi:hypothetical protein
LQFYSNREQQPHLKPAEVLQHEIVHNLLMHAARQKRHQLDRLSPCGSEGFPSPPASKRLRVGHVPSPGPLQGGLSRASSVAERELALSDLHPPSGTTSGLNRATSGSNASEQLSLAAAGLGALDALAAAAEQEWELRQQQLAQADWEQRQQQLQQQAEQQQLLLVWAQQLLQPQAQQIAMLPETKHYHMQRLLQHLFMHLRRSAPPQQPARQPLHEQQQQAPREQPLPWEQRQQAPLEQPLPREQQQSSALVQLLHRLRLLAQQQPAARAPSPQKPQHQPVRPLGASLTLQLPPPQPLQQPSLAELQLVALQALLRRLPLSPPQQQQELSSQPATAPAQQPPGQQQQSERMPACWLPSQQ